MNAMMTQTPNPAAKIWQWRAPHLNDGRFFLTKAQGDECVRNMSGWVEVMPEFDPNFRPKPAKAPRVRKPKAPKWVEPMPWEKNRRF